MVVSLLPSGPEKVRGARGQAASDFLAFLVVVVVDDDEVAASFEDESLLAP